MRLAVISDIHGNLLALEWVLADIKTRAVDATVNLGDLAAGPLWPRETVELLQSLGLPTVRGNHDRWMHERLPETLPPADRFAVQELTPADRAWMHALPARIEFEDTVLAVHGTPTDDSTYLTEETMEGRMVPASRSLVVERLGGEDWRDVVLCGHSHRQSITQIPGGPLIVNPGTVGCPVFADIPSAHRIEYRSPHARYAILTRRGGRWGAEMIALEYDWDRAAAQALANGFPRWAQAYGTGAVA